jgi:hypothetical protein
VNTRQDRGYIISYDNNHSISTTNEVDGNFYQSDADAEIAILREYKMQIVHAPTDLDDRHRTHRYVTVDAHCFFSPTT